METTPHERPDKRFDPEDVTRTFVLNVVLPGWSLAGLLDWYWHRTTKIERTAGAHESMMHLLMACEGGICAVTPLLFEIDAGVMAVVAAAALVHEATVIWDVNYTKSRRTIHQYEQHTHSFMEVLPFATVALMTLMHPGAAAALIGTSRKQPRFALRFKRDPSPPRTIAVLSVCGLLGVLPHLEEFVRCLHAKPTLAPQPVPDRAPER